MWKACAFANAARNGLFAAMLARFGMTGPSPIFEGQKGFMELVSGPLDLPPFGGERGQAPASDRSQSPVRAPFKVLETYIKHYPVEYHAQAAVEAALVVRVELLDKEGRSALAGIAGIEVAS